MPFEEEEIQQQDFSQNINETDTGNDSPVDNNINPMAGDDGPPPDTNKSGAIVSVQTRSIQVAEADIYTPRSVQELDELVSQEIIEERHKRLFVLKYEAWHGELPKTPVPPGEEPEKEEKLNDGIIDINAVLPELNEQPTTEDTGPDMELNAMLQEGTNEKEENGQENTGPDKNMPVPQGSGIVPEAEAPIDMTGVIPTDEVSDGGDDGGGEELSMEGTDNPAGGGGGGGLPPAGPKAPLPTADGDPDFQQVSDKVQQTGDEEQEHESADNEADEAQKSALAPANEKQSLAEVQHVDKMDQQEAKPFDAAGFKDMLMSKIKSILPRTEEDADKFKDSGKINQVKSAAQGQVDQKKTEAAGNIEATNKQTPDQSGVNGKEVEALPNQDIGKTPQSIEADKAMPKPMEQSQVETPLEDNSKAMDQQMVDNEITDEQLANSNEPAFVQTLDNKNQAQEHSKSAPQQLRVEEQTIVQSNKDSAKTSGDEQVSQMHEDRSNMLGQVEQQQQNTATEDTAERTKIATDINGIFQQTKTDVDSILSKLDAKVQQLFDAAAGRAKSRFESYVDKEMQAYKDERYSGLDGALTWVGDAFTGLPDEVNAFFERGRELYIQEMDKAIGQIANVVATDLNAAKQRIVQGKEQVNQYVEDLPSNLQSIGQEAADNITAKFDELDQSVDAKQSELIDSLAEQYKSSVEAVDSKIEAMKAENRGLFDMAFDQLAGVIGTIVDLKNQLTELFASAVQAITSIINDPIGFLGNLIEGVGMGLNNFMSNITTHLTSGFVEWLTGAMSGVGIELPENIFSLEGIFSLVTQALGLTYDYIRGKAVKLLGERTVKVIEEGFEIFKIIQTDGISGVWEYLKEQFNDLKDTIIGAITEMLVTQVVEAGIKWIIGLMSPAGAFIKAVLMIIDVAQFFIEQGSKIMELVSAFVNSVNAIAAGSLGQVAAFIEDALARSVPILIDFLASLLGVGGIADKVQDIFTSIHERIDAAIDGFSTLR